MFVWLLQESWAMDPWQVVAVYETEEAAVKYINEASEDWIVMSGRFVEGRRMWTNGMGNHLMLKRMEVLK